MSIEDKYTLDRKIKKFLYFVQEKLRNCAILFCLNKSKLTYFHSLICKIFVWKRPQHEIAATFF